MQVLHEVFLCEKHSAIFKSKALLKPVVDFEKATRRQREKHRLKIPQGDYPEEAEEMPAASEYDFSKSTLDDNSVKSKGKEKWSV